MISLFANSIKQYAQLKKIKIKRLMWMIDSSVWVRYRKDGRKFADRAKTRALLLASRQLDLPSSYSPTVYNVYYIHRIRRQFFNIAEYEKRDRVSVSFFKAKILYYFHTQLCCSNSVPVSYLSYNLNKWNKLDRAVVVMCVIYFKKNNEPKRIEQA